MKTRRARANEGERRGAASDVVRIYGFHAVLAALRAPRRELVRLYATPAASESSAPSRMRSSSSDRSKSESSARVWT